MSERYSPLATVAPTGNSELYEILEAVNDDLRETDYVVFDLPYEDYVIAREDENGDWEVVGEADMYGDRGDEYEATDVIAENRSEDYLVVAEPYGTRKIVYDHSTED